MNKDDDKFYLQSNINYKKSGQWFKKQPVGQNKISTITNKMTENSGIGKDKRLTNTSARKYLITKLSDANIPDRQIVQISGHKNIQSINSYAQLSRKRQHEISDIMSGKTDNLPNSSNSSDVVTASMASSTCMTASSVPGMSFWNNCTVHRNVTIHIGETSAKFRRDEHSEISQFQPN